jgi:hypothetical protein
MGRASFGLRARTYLTIAAIIFNWPHHDVRDLNLCRQLLERLPEVPVLVLRLGDPAVAVRCLHAGVSSFSSSP